METAETERMLVVKKEASFYFGEEDYCCRCCLTTGFSVANTPLFNKDNHLYYTSCIGISITTDDGFPKYLCEECCEKLMNFNKFLEMCKQSHETMQKILESDRKNREFFSMKSHVHPVYNEDSTGSFPEKHKETGHQSHNDNKWDSDDYKNKFSYELPTVSMPEKQHNNLSKSQNRAKTIAKSSENDNISFKNCPVCKAQVKKALLKRHMQIHNLNKPLYYCKVCKKNFKCASHSERHNENNFIVCQICGKSIFSKTYEVHIKRHNKQKDHTCTLCGQKFYQRSMLKHHTLDRHMGRKYTCDYCKKEFITKFAITTHIYRHSETPRFKCDLCKKAYTSHWVLTLHKRTHTGTKPYKCGVCQRSFSTLSEAKRHKITHTEEKQFVCEYCSFAYKHRSSYKRHSKTCKKKKEKKSV